MPQGLRCGSEPHEFPYPNCQGFGADRFERCFAEAISLPRTRAPGSK
ncbi:hypothetical protein L842_0317 [Mycobacterium intracellulare MIN_052511_1280]|nr:hypothetical protein L842_0317 [Mycobacterium intracellulare MIN_052511_1280]